jgi:hypothetical protein
MIFFIYNSNKLKHQVARIAVTRWKQCTRKKKIDKIHEEREPKLKHQQLFYLQPIQLDSNTLLWPWLKIVISQYKF